MFTTINSAPEIGRNGMLAEGEVEDQLSRSNQEIDGMNFGRIVADYDSKDNSCRLPLSNKVSGGLSTALVSGQTITATLVCTDITTGVNTTQSTSGIVFITSHDNTFGTLLKNAVEALNFVGVGKVTVDANKFTVNVAEPKQATLTLDVTGGAPPTVAYSYDSNDEFIGLSIEELKQPNSAGNYIFNQFDTVKVGRKTKLYIICKTAFTKKSTAYVMLRGANRGFLRTNNSGSDSKEWTAVKFLNSGSADGLAKVEINLP